MKQPTIYGDGEQSRDFTYIDNVVHANLLAAAAPAEKVKGQMMNSATSCRITLNETFKILCELTGYKGDPAYAVSRAREIFETRLRIFGWRVSCLDTSPLSISAKGCAGRSTGIAMRNPAGRHSASLRADAY